MEKRFRKLMAGILSAAMVVTAVPAVSLSVEATPVEGNTDLSRQVAADGMILLKNDNDALPLAKNGTVAMFGQAMINYVRGGGGSGQTNVDYEINILQGMQQKEEEGKVKLYRPFVDFYTTEVTANGKKSDADIHVTDDMLDDAAKEASTAIVTLGGYSGEGSDRTPTKGDYYLSDAEEQLITRVAAEFEKTVVVLNVGAVMDTEWINRIEGIDSVLIAWQAGQEGGLATADILVGDVNPSGKTVDTWAKDYWDYPSAETFLESDKYVNYTEDIFVGYRYFETFDPNYEKVNYEFGYGLSYTTFDISDVNVAEDEEKGEIAVEAKVTNTGGVAGKEVVEVYFSAPQGKLGKPAKELAAFDKTKLLEPGESEVLTMRYAISDMSSYDDTGKVQKSAYIMEAGDYNIYVGNSIKDAGEQGIRYTYKLGETVTTEQLTQKCAPIQLGHRLLADGTYEDLECAPEYNVHNTISATGSSIAECENFIASSGDIDIEEWTDDAGVKRRCIVRMNAAGKYADYDLNVEEAGTYAVSMHVANGGSDISNCLGMYVNGEPQPGVLLDAKGTGGWYKFVDSEPFYVSLPKGKATFRIEAKKNNPNYDYITFTKVDSEPVYDCQTVAAEGRTRIEAESYTLSGGVDATVVTRETFTKDGNQGQCLARMNVGNHVSYWLDVEEAGEYNLYFSAANGGNDFAYNPGIEINGILSGTTSVTIPAAQGTVENKYYNFLETTPATVTLPKGKCLLTLEARGKYYPNLDFFEFEKKEEASTGKSRAAVSKSSRAAGEETEQQEKIMLLDVYNNRELMDDFLAQLSDEQLLNMLGGQQTVGIGNTDGMANLQEYGIPGIIAADGPQGIRVGGATATAWPISTLLACTWDVELVEKVGKAAGIEAKKYGIDIWLAPGMNIHRNPLCGRNFEYYSEDPYVTGKMAAAMTKGCQSEGVSITLKHFAGNDKEKNRTNSDSRMSERALREIYLKGFEIAVKEADPWSIMSSYNLLNGTETAEKWELLTGIARNEWGYEGLFMTDWANNNSNHAKEVLAGNDVKMYLGEPDVLRKALKDGVITREDMLPHIERLMNLTMKVNSFQDKIVNPLTVDISAGTRMQAAEKVLWSSILRSDKSQDETGGERNLSFCDKGAWAEYRINVEKEDAYLLSARSASYGNGAFNVLVDGEVIADFKAVNTGGYQSWTTLDAKHIYLTEGIHTMRIEFTESGSNLNWLEFNQDDSVGRITETPEITIGKPVFGGKVSEADAAIGKNLPYTAETVWTAEGSPAGIVFEGDISYTAQIKLKAADGYIFSADAMPSQIIVDGQKVELTDDEVKANAGKTEITLIHTFEKTEKDLGVYTGKKLLLSIIYNAYAGLDVSAYTKDSAKALADALKEAAALLENKDATEAQLEKAAEDVLAAAAGLVLNTEELSKAIKAADDAAKAANTVAQQALAAAAENKTAAETAQATAEAAQRAADAAKQAADTAKEEAAANKEAAEQAAQKAQAAQEKAEKAEQAAQAAQEKAEKAEQEAKEAKEELEKAQQAADTQKEELAKLTAQAEAAQKAAEEARAKAEAAEKAALEAKAAYEKAQQQADPAKPTEPEQPAVEIKAGQTYDSGDYSYKVTDVEKLTAEVVGIKNTALTKITVYNKVTLGGKSYKVTSVSASAFKGNKKVASAVIGKNVVTIGSSAFSGCTKLKKVTVKSTALTQIGGKAFLNCKNLKNITIKSKSLKKVGANAFRGISAKAVIKVPAAKYKAYAKLLAKKGQGKTVKVKK